MYREVPMLPSRETESIEFKKTLSELKEGIISLTSMLNKGGVAHLYFGIKNDGTVFGQEIGESSTKKIANEIKNFIKPSIFPRIETVEEGGKSVILVTALGDERPYSAYGRYYKRLDDQDLAMSPSDLEKAFSSRDATYSSWETQLTPYGESCVNEDELIAYVEKANDANRLDYRYRDVSDCLTRLGLMKDGFLNNAGLYLFGKNKPLAVKLAIFATDDRLSFIDNRRFEGNILECIEEALKYVASNIHFHAEIVGFERVEKPEIPLEAIREIVINSFAHMRVTPGEYNEITITPKRVRIYNPGLIAMNKDPREFANGNVGSKIRNPLIATALYRSKSIEALGTGFRRAFDLCDAQGVSYAYGTDGVGFTFEFFRPDAMELKESVSKKAKPTRDYETCRVPQGVVRTEEKRVSYNSSEVLLRRFMEENGGLLLNASDAAKELGKSRVTIQRAIQSMVQKGMAERIGSHKSGHWVLLNEETGMAEKEAR